MKLKRYDVESCDCPMATITVYPESLDGHLYMVEDVEALFKKLKTKIESLRVDAVNPDSQDLDFDCGSFYGYNEALEKVLKLINDVVI